MSHWKHTDFLFWPNQKLCKIANSAHRMKQTVKHLVKESNCMHKFTCK